MKRSAAFLLLAAGCGRSGFPTGDDRGPNIAFPAFRDGAAGDDDDDAATPDNGDGHDGPFLVTGNQVVNACLPVGSASGTSVDVPATVPITVGDRVLLFQVQDGTGVSGETAPIAAAGSAGNWELARVSSLDATSLSLEAALAGSYASDASRTAQVCTVPEFTDVTFVAPSDAILAAPWNGAAGGVVAFFASGALDLGGTISASGLGFRGGAASGVTGAEDITALDTPATDSGAKGEGVDVASRTLFGKGNRFNAGGGGNGNEAGGAGGSNAGAGGFGGSQTDQVSRNTACRGLGGAPMALPDGVAPRWVFGGGGGGGHRDDSLAQGPGGAGGGLVLLFVREIRGAGTIRADGANGASTGSNAAGGGGAGGTIALRATDPSPSFTGSLHAEGHPGGSDTDSSDSCRGPGGGGGGGRILLEGLDTALGFVQGGLNGTCPVNESWDATGGSAGVVQTWQAPL